MEDVTLVRDGLLASCSMSSYWHGAGLLCRSQHYLEDRTISAFSLFFFFKSPFAPLTKFSSLRNQSLVTHLSSKAHDFHFQFPIVLCQNKKIWGRLQNSNFKSPELRVFPHPEQCTFMVKLQFPSYSKHENL